MDGVERVWGQLLGGLARLMGPFVAGLERLGTVFRLQLANLGVPYGWQSPITMGLWIVGVLLLLRGLQSGWARLIVLVVVGALLATSYGVLE